MARTPPDAGPGTATLLRIKETGNTLFARAKWAAAADAYTEGIALCGAVLPGSPAAGTASTLYSNRSQCRRLLGDHDAMESDAVAARSLDPMNAKAHWLIGCAFLRREEYAVGVRHLEKGLEMARRTHRPPALLREFEVAIATGRADWHHSSTAEDRINDVLLHSYCVSAMETQLAARLCAAAAASAARDAASSLAGAPAAMRRSVRCSVVVPPVAGEAPTMGDRDVAPRAPCCWAASPR